MSDETPATPAAEPTAPAAPVETPAAQPVEGGSVPSEQGNPETSVLTEQPAPATAPAEAAPVEPLTFEQLTIPQGMEITAEQAAPILSAINDPALSPAERGNALIAAYEAQVRADYTAWQTSQRERGEAVLADPELGGDKWPQTQARITAMINEFSPDPDGLRRELVETGMGNSIHLVRLFAKLGELVGEGKPVVGASPNNDKPLEQRMYPSMEPNK